MPPRRSTRARSGTPVTAGAPIPPFRNTDAILDESQHSDDEMDRDQDIELGEDAVLPSNNTHQPNHDDNAIPLDNEDDEEEEEEVEDEEELPTEEGEEEEEEEEEEDPYLDTFDPSSLSLKEISNLAHFRVSSYKPGNGVAQMLSDDLSQYWQSDGLQPHHLTMKFTRMVEIRALRFYVDQGMDESYTPTLIHWFAGTSEHDLIKFAETSLSSPTGWQDVPIADSGGGEDGHSLCCFLVQMQVKENHQNGKDTHIRGMRVYGFDEEAMMEGKELAAVVNDIVMEADHGDDGEVSRRLLSRRKEVALQNKDDDGDEDALDEFFVDSITRQNTVKTSAAGTSGWAIPDFMSELVIR